MAKPKKPSPKTTIWIPPNEECPSDWTACYKDVLDDVVREIIQTQVAQGIERARGLENLKWDLIIPAIRAEIITPYNVYEYEWPSTDWPCLEQFFDGIRSRLDELFSDFSPKFIELFKESIDVADIGKRAWNSYLLPKLSDIRETERQSGYEAAKDEGLSGILGLERGERSRGQVARLAGIKLNRWDTSDFKDVVRAARDFL